MLNIIDRYISKIFLSYFVGGLLVFATLFLAIDFMSFFIRHNAPIQAVLRYYAYYFPEIIYQMIPVACLLSVIFTLSGMSKRNELVVLFSSGLSLARISAPILSVVALISVLSFWMSDRLLPRMSQQKNYVLYVEIENKPGLYSTVKTGRIWYRSKDILFNIKTLNTEKGRAQGLTLYYFDDAWNMSQVVRAQEVDLQKGGVWRLKDGSVTLFTEQSSFPLTQNFDRKVITMNEDVADLESSANTSEVMSLAELSRFIEKNKAAGLDTLRYEVDYHSKFSFAFAALVMSLIGIPFSVSRPRSGGAASSIGGCLLLTFVYWAMYSSGITLGKHGALPPLVAAWAPNIVTLILSLFFLVRLKK